MKVLILTCNTGGGHNAAAKAISKELTRRNIENEVKDALEFVPRTKKELIENGHSIVYKYAPNLFGEGYEFLDKQPHNHLLYMDFSRYALFISNYIAKHQFDTAVCVHEFPAIMLSNARNLYQIEIKQYFVATDYTCSPGVNDLTMDKWFIPFGLKNEFAEKGIDAEKIVETGIPVDSLNYEKIDKIEARRALGIREDIPLVLISAGTFGCGPVKEIAEELRKLGNEKAGIVILCGRNKSLLKDLAIEIEDGLFFPVGFTDKVRLWMAAADVLITKAGGLSTTEAASLGLPMVFINAIPGLETHNLNFFVNNGCGLTSDDVGEICRLAKELYENDEKALEIIENQRKLFSINSVKLLVDNII